MTEQLTFDTCVLCGATTGGVHMRLVEWIEPVGNQIWSHIPRCDDRAACRVRVERELHEAWQVNDRTPAPEPAAVRPESSPLHAVIAPAEPDEPAKEALPWLRG